MNSTRKQLIRNVANIWAPIITFCWRATQLFVAGAAANCDVHQVLSADSRNQPCLVVLHGTFSQQCDFSPGPMQRPPGKVRSRSMTSLKKLDPAPSWGPTRLASAQMLVVPPMATLLVKVLFVKWHVRWQKGNAAWRFLGEGKIILSGLTEQAETVVAPIPPHWDDFCTCSLTCWSKWQRYEQNSFVYFMSGSQSLGFGIWWRSTCDDNHFFTRQHDTLN